MRFGEIFADAWKGATDTAKAASSMIATGAEKVGAAVKWTGEKVVEGAKWAAEKTVEGAKWAAKKAAEAAEWAARTAVQVGQAVVKAVGIAKEVARNLTGLFLALGRAFNEDLLGKSWVTCMIETLRGWIGKNISSEDAAEALPDAYLAQAVYGDGAPPGWTRVSENDPRFTGVKFNDPDSGFKAAIFEGPDGRVVLAFAGTEDSTDWKTNFQQGMGNVPEQYELAKQLAHTARFVYGDRLSITGHSLGGGLATYSGLHTGTPTTAFNAAGLAQGARNAIGAEKLAANGHLVRNYNVIGEALSDSDLLQNSSTFGINASQVGETHWIPSQPGGGPVGRHSMENVIPSLQTAASGG